MTMNEELRKKEEEDTTEETETIHAMTFSGKFEIILDIKKIHTTGII